MSKLYSNDFVFQATTLVLAFLIMHVPWTLVVRPRARVVLETQAREMRDRPRVHPGALVVGGLKDCEQESEVILGLWAFASWAQEWHAAARAAAARTRPGARAPGMRILPEDTREYARPLEALPPVEAECLLPRALARGPVPLRRDAQRAGRLRRRARGVRRRGRPARLGALDAPLHRLGHPGDRLHRHGARHRRRARRGAQGGDRRRLRRHRGASVRRFNSTLAALLSASC